MPAISPLASMFAYDKSMSSTKTEINKKQERPKALLIDSKQAPNDGSGDNYSKLATV
jgi:hypothetical protein